MEGGAAQAAGSGAFQAMATMVPWNQIPKFVPGETDIRVYTRKLEFLRALWPREHLEHLGPRAALQVEGVAFQKVSRLDPEKLRGADGVAYLVSALGGQWGKLEAEDKFELFERALYLVQQKPDESHDSYLARHDAAFEDLLGRKVEIEEFRAYILLRQSLLSSEDRKKVIMDQSGALTYDNARKQIRLLGSKFFQDLQAGGGGSKNLKLKTYDVNYVDDDAAYMHEDDDEDEETFLTQLLEQGDEDAMFVNAFEEQILVACQESSELAQCFATYQEARFRLKEKAKTRGFWPLSGAKGRGRSKGFGGKGKSSGMGKMSWGANSSFMGRRRSLADRIANSTCRRCGKPGHWKRECPLAQGSSPRGTSKKLGDQDTFTGMMDEGYEILTELEDQHQSGLDVVPALPDNAIPYTVGTLEAGERSNDPKCGGKFCYEGVFVGDVGVLNHCLSKTLLSRLRTCCRNTDSKTAVATDVPSKPRATAVTFLPDQKDPMAGDSVIFNAEEADDEAIIDTGASRAVIGAERLKRLVGSFPNGIRTRVMRVPTEGVVFKFGNAGRLASTFAVLLPRAQNDWLRVEVVPGHTPFLISNAVLGKLRGIVDVGEKRLRFGGSEMSIPLFEVRKNLLGVKVMDLLSKTPKSHTRAQTHILHTEDNFEDQPHMSHDYGHVTPPLHEHHHEELGGIQEKQSGFPKENDVQNFSVFHESSAVSQLSYPEHTTGGIPLEGSTAPVHHHGGPGDLSHSSTQRSRGSFTADASGASRHSQDSSQTSRSGHTGGMGNDSHPGGQAPREEILRDLHQRSSVCEATLESKGSQLLGQEFSTVLQAQTGGECGTSTGRDSSPRSADANQPSHDTRGCRAHQEGRGTMAITTIKCQGHQGEEPEGSSTSSEPKDRPEEGQCRMASCGDREQSEQAWTSHRIGQFHGDSAQSGQSESTLCSDRGAAERSATRIARNNDSSGECMKWLTPEEVILLNQHLDKASRGIADQLHELKRDPKYCDHWKPMTGMKSPKDIPKKKRGVSQRVDLLEVYCEPESSLTRVCNQKGGRAIRFTRNDGDLTTKEGVQRLWTWIEMYEPRNVWVAPECRLWGNWSRFNMGRSEKGFEQIYTERQSDLHTLELCNQIYLYQVAHGRHFHMEQPRGSEMIQQPQLQDTRMGTLPATFDMCQVGRLKLPLSEHFLQKRTQVSQQVENCLKESTNNFVQKNMIMTP